jgi:hypothetical protein
MLRDPKGNRNPWGWGIFRPLYPPDKEPFLGWPLPPAGGPLGSGPLCCQSRHHRSSGREAEQPSRSSHTQRKRTPRPGKKEQVEVPCVRDASPVWVAADLAYVNGTCEPDAVD